VTVATVCCNRLAWTFGCLYICCTETLCLSLISTLACLFLLHGWAKNVTLYFCLYLRQYYWSIFKILSLSSLAHSADNLQFGKWKKHFRPTLRWMIWTTLDCVGLTQFIVIRIIIRNVDLKCFSYSSKCLLLSFVFTYIYISQRSVETHLQCGGMYTNRIVANCLQNVPLKELLKSVNNWRRHRQKWSVTFFGPWYTYVRRLYVAFTHWDFCTFLRSCHAYLPARIYVVH